MDSTAKTPIDPPSPLPSDAASQRPAPLRLDYIDGVRGLAALVVVVCHVSHELVLGWPTGHLPAVIRTIMALSTVTHVSIAVFIVLSGYCLMLPVARSASGKNLTGFSYFMKRRARRILPPYFAALFFSFLLYPMMTAHGPPTAQWIAHLLLLQDLRDPWRMNANVALWSIATEWQIYFLFPLLLIPMWRRGYWPLLLTAVTLAAVLFCLGLGTARPWFIALFALGMTGAALQPAPQPAIKTPLPLIELAAFFLVAFAAMQYLASGSVESIIIPDLFIGLATMCFLIAAMQSSDSVVQHMIVRFFQSRTMVGLGTFSYSLYLIHSPILVTFRIGLARTVTDPVLAFWILLFVGVPLAVAVAYQFFRFFEQPFLTKKAGSGAPKRQ